MIDLMGSQLNWSSSGFLGCSGLNLDPGMIYTWMIRHGMLCECPGQLRDPKQHNLMRIVALVPISHAYAPNSDIRKNKHRLSVKCRGRTMLMSSVVAAILA